MRRKRLPPKGWNKDRPFGLGGPLNSGHGDLAPARGHCPCRMRPPLSSSQSPLSSVSACGENCACSLAPPLPTARGAAGAPHRDIKKKTLQRGFSCPCGAIHLLRRARPPEGLLLPLRGNSPSAPRPVEKKKCSAGRSAPAQTSCRRRGMVGGPAWQSGTETRRPWGNLQPGEVWDTSSFSFRCRWPVIDESFSIGQGNSFYDRPGSA